MSELEPLQLACEQATHLCNASLVTESNFAIGRSTALERFDGIVVDSVRRLRQLPCSSPRTAVYIATDDRATTRDVMRSGAVPFTSPVSVDAVVRFVTDAQQRSARTVAVLDHFRDRYQLTAAELRILRATFSGVRRHALSTSLGRSEATVRNQISSILRKCTEDNLAGVIGIAFEVALEQ